MHLLFPHFHVTCRHDTDPTLFIRIVYNNYIVYFQVSHISPIHAWQTIVVTLLQLKTTCNQVCLNDWPLLNPERKRGQKGL